MAAIGKKLRVRESRKPRERVGLGRGSETRAETAPGRSAWATQFSLLAERPGVSVMSPAPHLIGQVQFILGIRSEWVSVSQVFGYPKLAHVLYCLFPLII